MVDAIIDKYLEPAASGRFSWIAGKIGESVERVQEAMQCIRRLNPKPGCAVGAANLPAYIIPDITVKKISGEYVILINDTQVPGLKINSYYRSLFREAEPDTRKYIEGRMNAAVWLIRSIEHRRRTLYKLMEALISLQRAFFDEGPKHLVPMTMKLVAEAINVHESTISRATAHKHVGYTPRSF